MTGQPRTNRDDPSGVQVCVSGITTTCTKELRLTLPISLINTSTYRTSPTGIPRINWNDKNTSKFGLVLNEGSELSECPRVDDSPLALPNRYPFADTLEVLNGDATMGVFSPSHQLFRDAMVDVSLETAFPSTSLLQQPLRGFGALALELRPELDEAGTHVVDNLAGEAIAVGCGGNRNDAKVNADKAGGFAWSWLGAIHRHGEIERTVPIQQVALTALAIQHGSLISPKADGHDDTTIKSQKRHPVQSLEGHDALVIGHGPARTERNTDGLVSLVGFRDLGNSPDCHLGRQAEAGTNFAIDELLERVLAGSMLAECYQSYPIAGSIEGFQRPQECGVLLGRRTKLDDNNLFHEESIAQLSTLVNREEPAFPPRSEETGLPSRDRQR